MAGLLNKNESTIHPDTFIRKNYSTMMRENPSRISYSDSAQKRSQIEAYFKYLKPVIGKYNPKKS